jgi:hypothetical protein
MVSVLLFLALQQEVASWPNYLAKIQPIFRELRFLWPNINYWRPLNKRNENL